MKFLYYNILLLLIVCSCGRKDEPVAKQEEIDPLVQQKRVIKLLVEEEENEGARLFIDVYTEMKKRIFEPGEWSANTQTTKAGMYYKSYSGILNNIIYKLSSDLPGEVIIAYNDYIIAMKELSEVMIDHPHIPEPQKFDWKFDLLDPFIGKTIVGLRYGDYSTKVSKLFDKVCTCRDEIIHVVSKYGIQARYEPYTFFLRKDWDKVKVSDFFDLKEKYNKK